MAERGADVIVIGAGNAALCAALAAREQGAQVTVLERAPMAERGGNSAFTAGNIRTVFNGIEDIKALVPDLTADEIAITDFGTYTEDQFFDDMGRVTEYRTDPELCELLVKRSLPTMLWLRDKGVRFNPIWGNQAFKIDGRFKFWGGLVIQAWGGGPGLVEALNKIAEREGIRVMYETRALSLLNDDDGVKGVRVRQGRKTFDIAAKAVVVAAGGFEANPEMRTRYLGPGWDMAKVRGTRFNTGDGIRMALEAGARAYGNWSGCHAVGWDFNAPEFGDLDVGDNFQKHSYPWGIMVNATGRRFVDEGADFRNYTYAKYGRVILNQPGQMAWQVFDSKVFDRLRAEYRIKRVTKVRADTLPELAAKLEGVDAKVFLEEMAAYNAAVETNIPYDPNVKDGRGTRGLAVNKTNWANTIADPPFEAYQVTCGITFTFGGLKVAGDAQVIDTEEAPIPGLYAAGELVGGLFYFNYPGGSGLTSGAVFGKIAGTAAGRAAVGNT
ncbi:MAG: FAD-binding dehydrogenase [Alphaproteobacteria bacterium]|nr:FAD-binding dehydrogenase [Alphaproteobacteria bacterium]